MSDTPEDLQAKRRIAQRDKHLYGDACRLAECAELLLKRTGFDIEPLEQVIESMRLSGLVATQIAEGPLESRKRFKGISSSPILEQCPNMYLFLDESGTSVTHVESAPPGHAVFSLGAVAMTETACKAYVKRANAIKKRFWGHDEITFHEPFMRKRSKEFYFEGDVRKQNDFSEALRRLLTETPFVAFGAVIRKAAYQKEFIETGRDPFLPTDVYFLAITMILERFVDHLAHAKQRYMGRLVFESQGPRQDAEHQHSYATIMIEGTRYVPENTFMNWLQPGCEFVPKSGSHPVELADILSRDLHEWGTSECRRDPAYWDIFRKKVYCRDRGIQGTFGIKVFPAYDLMEQIYAHRKSCGAEIPITATVP